MTLQVTARDSASEVLGQHREEFATAWAEAVRRSLPASHYARLPVEEFTAAAIDGIDTILRYPAASPDAEWPETGITSPRYLLQAGFDVSEVFEAALLALEVLPSVVRQDLRLDAGSSEIVIAEMSALMRRFLGGFAAAFAAEALGQIQNEQRRTAMMLEAARAASSTLDLKEVLRRAASVLAAVAGTAHCWFYLVHKDEKSGGVWAETDDAAYAGLSTIEPLTRALRHAALQQTRPFACLDAEQDPVIDSDWSRENGLKSLLFVPLVIENRVLGVAVAPSFGEHRQFTREQLELAQGIANVVAPAIENARLYRRAERIAVMYERLRLARELHDDLAQELGFLSLQTAAARELLAGGEIAHAEAVLAETAQVTEQAYQGLREAIFGLRVSVHSGPDFWPALTEYLVEYQAHYGVNVEVAVGEGASMAFGPQVAVQLSHIILEALTNVRKHSSATRVWVRVGREGGQVRVDVEDDGQGFDAPRVLGSGGFQVGLQMMRERAESVGGRMQVDSFPGRGTRVSVWVPLASGG